MELADELEKLMQLTMLIERIGELKIEIAHIKEEIQILKASYTAGCLKSNVAASMPHSGSILRNLN